MMTETEPQSFAAISKTELPCLYFGTVMHSRLRPKPHRFSYRVFSLMVDIDRLKKTGKTPRLFSFNRRNLVAFHEADHGPRDGSGLRPWVDTLLANGGLARPARVLLLSNPRVLGYTFNPLSIYYCLDPDGAVYALVYQVHNTFGESHAYVAGLAEQKTARNTISQHAEKRLYVSPFIGMDMQYRFYIDSPGKTVANRIFVHNRTGPLLAATFNGEMRPLTAWQLALGILSTTGLSWKITAGIHYEALRLWLKRVALQPRVQSKEPASFPNQETRLVEDIKT